MPPNSHISAAIDTILYFTQARFHISCPCQRMKTSSFHTVIAKIITALYHYFFNPIFAPQMPQTAIISSPPSYFNLRLYFFQYISIYVLNLFYNVPLCFFFPSPFIISVTSFTHSDFTIRFSVGFFYLINHIRLLLYCFQLL